jgi:hypothetical protein
MKKLLAYLICFSLLFSACSPGKSHKASEFARITVDDEESAEEIDDCAPHAEDNDDKLPTETKYLFSCFSNKPQSYSATTGIPPNHDANWFAKTTQCLEDNGWNDEIYHNRFIPITYKQLIVAGGILLVVMVVGGVVYGGYRLLKSPSSADSSSCCSYESEPSYKITMAADKTADEAMYAAPFLPVPPPLGGRVESAKVRGSLIVVRDNAFCMRDWFTRVYLDDTKWRDNLEMRNSLEWKNEKQENVRKAVVAMNRFMESLAALDTRTFKSEKTKNNVVIMLKSARALYKEVKSFLDPLFSPPLIDCVFEDNSSYS